MAKVVIQPSGDRYVKGNYNWIVIALIGAALGALTWLVSWALGSFVVDPLLCRDMTLQACGRSGMVAGNLAVVVTAVVGAVTLIRLHVRHALWVVVAVVFSFWGLGGLIEPFAWSEAIAWMAGLYALGYVLFAWILRLRSTFIAMILVIAVALLFRWVAFL